MLARSLFLLPFLVVLGSSRAAIDLTPAVTETVEEGVTYREVSFKTPEGKVAFTLPPGWTISGQANRAEMIGADKSSANAVVEVIPLLKPEPLDEATVAKFKEQVLRALPAGSAKVATVCEAQNSITPGGNSSFEFVITYDLWGKVFQRSALLVNGQQERLMFRFTCLKSDFAVLSTNFRRSLMTWHAVAAQNVVAETSPASPSTN